MRWLRFAISSKMYHVFIGEEETDYSYHYKQQQEMFCDALKIISWEMYVVLFVFILFLTMQPPFRLHWLNNESISVTKCDKAKVHRHSYKLLYTTN